MHDSLLNRLPRYYRYSRELLGSDVLRISSAELASMMELSAPLVRQDMSQIGHCGQQGYGYSTRDIFDNTGDLIGIGHGWNVVIAGMGTLGSALASQKIFTNRGIHLCALFDYGEAVGKQINSLTVLPMLGMTEYCRENAVDIAVLCVPPEQALEACSLALHAGIRGIWNFTGEEIRPERFGSGIAIQNVNLGDMLLELCCRMNNESGSNDKETTDLNKNDR